jgi:hypothetical protein
MKRLVCAMALVVVLCTPARPEGTGRWLKRVTLAAACAASFWDAQTTALAVSRGAREVNGFLADSAGKPQWGRMIGVKAATCGGLVLVEEKLLPRHEKSWISLNVGLSAVYSGMAVHNLGVARSLNKP